MDDTLRFGFVLTWFQLTTFLEAATQRPEQLMPGRIFDLWETSACRPVITKMAVKVKVRVSVWFPGPFRRLDRREE